MKKWVGVLLLAALVFSFIIAPPLSTWAAGNKELFLQTLYRMPAPDIAGCQLDLGPDAKFIGNLAVDFTARYQEDGEAAEKIKGQAIVSVKMDSTIPRGQINLNFTGTMDSGKESIPLQANITLYIDKDRVIIPGQDLRNLAVLFDEEVPENLPEYVYQEVSDPAFTELMAEFKKLQSEQQSYLKNWDQFQLQAWKAYLTPLPEECFTHSNEALTLTITKKALLALVESLGNEDTSQALVRGLMPLNSATEVEQIAALLQAMAADEGVREMLESMEVKDCSIKLQANTVTRQADLTFRPEGGRIDVILAARQDKDSLHTQLDCSLGVESVRGWLKFQEDDRVQNQRMDSRFNLDLGFSDEDMGLGGFMKGTVNSQKDQAGMDLQTQLQFKDSYSQLSVDAGIKGNIQIEKSLGLLMPTLTTKNSQPWSVVFPEPEPEYPEGWAIFVDGEDLDLGDSEPVVQEGELLVPLRKVIEFMAGEVTWTPPGNVAIKVGETELIVTNGSSECTVNGATVKLNTAVQNIDGIMYVPVEDLARELEYLLEYDLDYQIIFLDQEWYYEDEEED